MVTELQSIQRWFAYNRVARQRYFETLAKLPPGELTRDRGASFPTLLDILGHSIGGIETWIVSMSAVFFPVSSDVSGTTVGGSVGH